MAQGASFHGANMSHSFRVRDILLSDGFNFKTQLVIRNLDEKTETDPEYVFKNVTLFSYKKRFGTKKQISLSPANDLRIELYATDLQSNTKPLVSYNLTNISRFYSNDKHYNDTIKVKLFLDFEIDSVEGVTLQEASIKFNYTEIVNYTEKVT